MESINGSQAELEKRAELRIRFLEEGKLSIDWEKYASMLEGKILNNQVEEDFVIQHGWLITGDGFRLNPGDEYFAIYLNGQFNIRHEFVMKTTTYGSDYYCTRYKYRENAEKFILDCQQKSYNQMVIKQACRHAGIPIGKIEKMYSFLQNNE
jgi:hypothetical protein